MKIKKINGRSNAKEATGFVVVIDILRAATVEAYAFSNGASYIIPVYNAVDAFALKKKDPSYILIGENNGYKINGFDYGNSPSEIIKVNLEHKILIHRSSSGTKGLVSAINSKELIFGSFVTAFAIATYLHSKNPDTVSLLALGKDDMICADYLELLLQGCTPDVDLIKKKVCEEPSVSVFMDDTKPEFPITDLELALQFNKFNFICFVEKINGGLKTIRRDVIT